MHPLHQQRRQGRRIVTMNFHFVFHGGREHAEDGLLQFFGNIEFFHAAFDQAGVTHQFRDDPV